MTDAQDFAAYLERAMEASGVTAAELARATGVSDSVVSRWRKGAIPSVENLRLVAPVLHVPVRDLVVVAGHMLPEEVGLEDIPEPPEPATSLYDDIRSDPRLTPEMAEAFVLILSGYLKEDSPRTPERKRRGA